MTEPEFSRIVDVRQCEERDLVLAASADECASLAERFDLVRIDRLVASVSLARDGEAVTATGAMEAAIVQCCAVSAEDLPVSLSEPLSLRFVPAAGEPAAEVDIEIDPSDPDEIEYSGTVIDLGEAVAQSLALAIDPFAVGPQAEEARSRTPSEKDGPFAALAALKRGSGEESQG